MKTKTYEVLGVSLNVSVYENTAEIVKSADDARVTKIVNNQLWTAAGPKLRNTIVSAIERATGIAQKTTTETTPKGKVKVKQLETDEEYAERAAKENPAGFAMVAQDPALANLRLSVAESQDPPSKADVAFAGKLVSGEADLAKFLKAVGALNLGTYTPAPGKPANDPANVAALAVLAKALRDFSS